MEMERKNIRKKVVRKAREWQGYMLGDDAK
jgi:hypothetical protein